MSESKWRKAHDPLYGKVPQHARNRGLVVSSPVHIEGDKLTVTSAIDKQELRFALLFWDRLIWPTSSAVHIESGQDEQFLEHEGILKRPWYEVWGAPANAVVESHFRAFEELDAREPGAWSMALGEKTLHLLGGDRLADGGGVTVALHRAIPIPNVDVPLAEILEFKSRRNAELLKLRFHLESIKDELFLAENPQDALSSKIAAIDRSCSDLLKCGSEWQFPMRLSDLDCSLNYNPISLYASAKVGWEFGQPFGLEAAAAAAGVTALVCNLNINRSNSFRGVRRPASPFRYSYLAHKELL